MYKRELRCAALALLVALPGGAATAQSLADGVPAFKAGGWVVLRTKDTMTDKVSCTGVLNGDYAIQLSETTMYVRVRGGVRSVTLRFDDHTPERLRLPSDFERRGTVVFSSEEFAKALGSSRIRMQVMTVLDNLDQKDLDITGIREAHENIKAGCPGEAQSAATAAPAGGSLCSTLVVTRMRQRGIAEGDVRAVCDR